MWQAVCWMLGILKTCCAHTRTHTHTLTLSSQGWPTYKQSIAEQCNKTFNPVVCQTILAQDRQCLNLQNIRGSHKGSPHVWCWWQQILGLLLTALKFHFLLEMTAQPTEWSPLVGALSLVTELGFLYFPVPPLVPLSARPHLLSSCSWRGWSGDWIPSPELSGENPPTLHNSSPGWLSSLLTLGT